MARIRLEIVGKVVNGKVVDTLVRQNGGTAAEVKALMKEASAKIEKEAKAAKEAGAKQIADTKKRQEAKAKANKVKKK